MLLGRDDERLALDRLLTEARAGRSGVLALVGEPGIGKTALLEHAAGQADGMRVLRARGIQSEAEVPFAGLAELLRPALGALDRIPAPQAGALAGALALEPATAQDRFAVGAATLSLLSAWAEESPVLLLVDDAHRLDAASAEALLFAARRLLADPIALVLAVREGEPSLLDGADLRVLRLAGLARSHAAELLRRTGAPDDALDRLYAATAGNPLALVELAPRAAQLTALPFEGPVPISASIAREFARRLGQLPHATRPMLLLAATDDTGDLAVLARAGLDAAQLAAAEDAGLVALGGGQLEFRHPLVRSAIYSAASGPERRAAHAAVAAALPDRDVDRRAWHLAAAATGPDPTASHALEQAGERARGRSAYAVAASAFERGARLAADEAERARLLLAAADSAWLGGDAGRTLALLGDARARAAAPGLTARIDLLEGYVVMRRGPVARGCELTMSAAGEVATGDPELAVAMLAEAVLACVYAGDQPGTLAASQRALEIAGRHRSQRTEFFAAMAHGMALVANGDGEAGAGAVRSAVAILEASGELPADPRALVWAALGPMWLREAEAGRSLIDRIVAQARSHAAIGALPPLLTNLGRDQATTDRWAAAEASYDEALRLARETGQRTEFVAALAGLAWLEARQGREAACREHAAEAVRLSDELGLQLFGAWCEQALGDLELGLGRAAAALEHHGAQAQRLRAAGIADVDVSPAPELVDAHLRLGHREDAAALAASFAPEAQAKCQPWALARATRARALVAEPDAAEPLFDEALRLHAQTPDAFETARTRFAYGAHLRRARRRVLAREQLRAALEAFERLGARTWADQAEAELAATGETARRRDASTLDQLTPQELQIAHLLAEGRTTREAAAAIFLSPKTVEYHLRSVYRKLGINSREELAARFAPAS
jgi:DNA-binding CsgD family transcriptional regulator